jgi:hypothetical protein
VQDDGSVVIDHDHAAANLDRGLLTQAVTQCPAAALRLLG